MTTMLTCPACGNRSFCHYLDTCDYSVSKEKFSLHQCILCGLLATWPQPRGKSLTKYYQSDAYISHSGRGESKVITKLYALARNFTLIAKAKMVEKYTTREAILDIGCGTGDFLRVMQLRGWQVHGIEPADEPREQAEKKLGRKLATNLAAEENIGYTAITLWHTLEHTTEPDQVLSICRKWLKPEGILIIAVPNYRSADAQHYRGHWAGYDVPRHLWHFSQNSIIQLLRKTDLELIQKKPMWLDAFYVSMMSESYIRANHTIAGYAKGFVQGLKSNIEACKTKEYSSTIYIARKSK